MELQKAVPMDYNMQNVSLNQKLVAARNGLAKINDKKNPVAHKRAVSALNRIEEDLFKANTRLIHNYLKKFDLVVGSSKYEEAYAAGSMGLILAIRKWDPALGALSTVVTFYLKNEILQVIRREESMLSRRDYQFRPQVHAESEKLSTSLGRYATDEEVCQASGLSIELVSRIRRNAAEGSVASLDEKVGGDDANLTRGDMLAETSAFEEAGSYDPEQLLDLLRSLPSIPAPELYTVLRYTGADGGPAETLACLAAAFNDSRETSRRRMLNGMTRLAEPTVLPKVFWAIVELGETLKRVPSNQELADMTGLDLEIVARVKQNIIENEINRNDPRVKAGL